MRGELPVYAHRGGHVPTSMWNLHAAAEVLLVYIGIQNAWDAATYLVTMPSNPADTPSSDSLVFGRCAVCGNCASQGSLCAPTVASDQGSAKAAAQPPRFRRSPVSFSVR